MHDLGQRPDRASTTRIAPLALEQMLKAADSLLDLLPIGLFVCDASGRIVQYNRRAAELWGRAPQPGDSNERFTGAYRIFRADGRPLALDKGPMAQALRTGEPVHNQQLILERPDESRAVIHVNVDQLRDEGGQLIGAVSCFQDITETRRAADALAESEQRLAATYEHAAIGIAETDTQGKLLRVNETVCAITGYSREELLARTVFEITHPDDRDFDHESYARQAEGEYDRYLVEKRLIRKDGRPIWVAVMSSTVRDATGHFVYGIRVLQDITERKQAETRQKLLLNELNHRVKNTLATVQSLAAQTARGTDSPKEFRKVFEGRLIGLSKAHDQLTLRHWHHADLAEILRESLAPYRGAPERITLRGETVELRPRAALTLAMTFHELVTNAAKYGALSVPTGKVEVKWRIDTIGDPVLRIDWSEHDGPEVPPPKRSGFGSMMVKRSIKADLGGTATLEFEPSGVRCRFDIPVAGNVT